jgi:hypothetical protein
LTIWQGQSPSVSGFNLKAWMKPALTHRRPGLIYRIDSQRLWVSDRKIKRDH